MKLIIGKNIKGYEWSKSNPPKFCWKIPFIPVLVIHWSKRETIKSPTMEQDLIESSIKEILKPFTYHKYGKTYIGEKETEGCIRIEGLVIQLTRELQKLLQSQRTKLIDEIVGLVEQRRLAINPIDELKTKLIELKEKV